MTFGDVGIGTVFRIKNVDRGNRLDWEKRGGIFVKIGATSANRVEGGQEVTFCLENIPSDTEIESLKMQIKRLR